MVKYILEYGDGRKEHLTRGDEEVVTVSDFESIFRYAVYDGERFIRWVYVGKKYIYQEGNKLLYLRDDKRYELKLKRDLIQAGYALFTFGVSEAVNWPTFHLAPYRTNLIPA